MKSDMSNDAFVKRGETIERESLAKRARAPGGRPRNHENDLAILAAAKQILINQGYGALSYEAITQKTGISRATIYRRWPSKLHLVNAIATDGPTTFADAEAKGSFEAQLRTILKMVFETYSRPEMPAAVSGLVSDIVLSAQLRKPQEEVARRDFGRIVDAARRNGEIRDDIDAETLFDIVVGSIIHRSLFSYKALRFEMIDEVFSIMVRGLLHP